MKFKPLKQAINRMSRQTTIFKQVRLNRFSDVPGGLDKIEVLYEEAKNKR